MCTDARVRSRHLLALLRKGISAGLLSCTVAAAHAQSRFCVGGDLEHLSAAQRTACSAKLAEVREAAHRFGAPEGWHFVMVCGEEGWKAYAEFSTRSASVLESASADTDLKAHTTYFREAKLGGKEPGAPINRALAHELAAVVLQTADETAIEARVGLWFAELAPAQERPAPVLTASR